MVFISKVNNYMFRPETAIFSLSQLQFCSKSVIYMSMSIFHSDVEISSSYYVLQGSLSSGMSSGSMNGGLWISLVGYVLGGIVYEGPWYRCSVYGSHVGLRGVWVVGLVFWLLLIPPRGYCSRRGVFCLQGSVVSACAYNYSCVSWLKLTHH